MERDHAVRGILNLTKMFKMFPETYAMAVNFMDRFLARLKVCTSFDMKFGELKAKVLFLSVGCSCFFCETCVICNQ